MTLVHVPYEIDLRRPQQAGPMSQRNGVGDRRSHRAATENGDVITGLSGLG